MQAQFLLNIMFIYFIQWQTQSILQSDKSTPKASITSITKHKIRSMGEVDPFTMRKTVGNEKSLSLGHLQNNNAGLVEVITMDDTQSLNLNIASESATLASPKVMYHDYLFWRGPSIKRLGTIENLESI